MLNFNFSMTSGNFLHHWTWQVNSTCVTNVCITCFVSCCCSLCLFFVLCLRFKESAVQTDRRRQTQRQVETRTTAARFLRHLPLKHTADHTGRFKYKRTKRSGTELTMATILLSRACLRMQRWKRMFQIKASISNCPHTNIFVLVSE